MNKRFILFLLLTSSLQCAQDSFEEEDLSFWQTVKANVFSIFTFPSFLKNHPSHLDKLLKTGAAATAIATLLPPSEERFKIICLLAATTTTSLSAFIHYYMNRLLVCLALQGRGSDCKTLLQLGADPDFIFVEEGKDHWWIITPLIAAYFSQKKELIQLLLDYGADPDLEGTEISTHRSWGWNWSIDKGYSSYNERWIKKSSFTPLFIATQCSQRCRETEECSTLSFMKPLLNAQVNPNIRDEDGNTLLHLLAEYDDDQEQRTHSLQKVRLLLSYRKGK